MTLTRKLFIVFAAHEHPGEPDEPIRAFDDWKAASEYGESCIEKCDFYYIKEVSSFPDKYYISKNIQETEQ